MNMKKILTTVVAAMLLVCVTIAGTVAYLKAESGTVTNTFTFGNITIKLDEAVVDQYGVATNERTEKGNAYKLMPGHTYSKDPTVTVNAGSEPCYVRVIVKIENWDDVLAIKSDALPQDYVNGWDNSVWECKSYVVEDTTATIEFWYREAATDKEEADVVDTLNAGKAIVLPDLFTEIKLPGTMTNKQVESLKDVKVIVKAYAIQSLDFADAQDAWNNWAN